MRVVPATRSVHHIRVGGNGPAAASTVAQGTAWTASALAASIVETHPPAPQIDRQLLRTAVQHRVNPNLLSARKSANESRAIGNIRTLYTQQAQEDLSARTNLFVLTNQPNAALESIEVGSFVYKVDPDASNMTWTVETGPRAGSGTKHFYVDATGIIRYKETDGK